MQYPGRGGIDPASNRLSGMAEGSGPTKHQAWREKLRALGGMAR
jgi:hypothetical protein